MTSPIDRTNKSALDLNLINGITSDAPKVKANNDTLYNYVDTLNNDNASTAARLTQAIQASSVSEVADARSSIPSGLVFATLKQRLDTEAAPIPLKADKTYVDTQDALKADKTYVDTLVNSVQSGSPKGVYATVTALQTAYPTGNTNTYVVSADGNWYFWNGSAWTAGGLYQTSPVINDTTASATTTYSSQLIESTIYDKKTINLGNSLAGSFNTPTNVVNVLGVATTETGVIKKIHLLLTVSGYVEICAYQKLASGNFKFYRKIYEGNLLSGVNNIDVEIKITSQLYFGFYSANARLAYNGSGSSYRLLSAQIGDNIAPTAVDAILAMNFDIEYRGIPYINEDIYDLKAASEATLFDIGTTITSDFYNDGNWVDNLSPTVTNSIMYFNKSTSFDKWVASVEILLRDTVTATSIVMCTKVQTGHNNTMLYVTFDLANKLIKIHQGWDGNVNDVPAVIVQGSIPFAPSYAQTYVLTVERDTVGHITASIVDKDSVGTSSLNRFSIDHYNIDPYGVTHGNSVDGVGLIHLSGSYYRNRFTMSGKCNPTPTLAIYGDSYIEGFGLTIYGDVRYASLIKNEMTGGQVTISCRGGEDTNGLLQKLTTDFSLIRAKYTLLAIGLNDVYLATSDINTYKANMMKLINYVYEIGSIPILVTIPKIDTSNAMYDQVNTWVRTKSGCRYVDFNKVLSNSDGSMNTSLFITSDIHPNTVGHKKMYDKFVSDCNYVFTNNAQVLQDQTIITPTFTNGWVARPGYAVGYTKDNTGRVQLYGLVQAGTLGTACFNLPNAYRPNYSKNMAVASNNAFGVVAINPSGDVIPTVGSTSWFSLDNISFYAGR